MRLTKPRTAQDQDLNPRNFATKGKSKTVMLLRPQHSLLVLCLLCIS